MKISLALVGMALCCSALAPASATLAAAPTVGKPTIAITSPANGATIHGSTITVHVAVSNFKLVKPVLLAPSQWKTIPLLKGNQGHIHYVLDSLANMVLSRDVVVRTWHSWTNVSPGSHTVIAYLATSQHARFPGTQPAVIHVTVVGGARAGGATGARTSMPLARPSIRITGVQTRSTRQGTAVVVHVAVSHFKLVPPVYQNPPKLPNNEGHIHYVLDDMSNFLATRDAVLALSHPWTKVSPGRHTIIAYLATSQHQHVPGTPIARARIIVSTPRTGRSSSVVRVVSALPMTGGAESANQSHRTALLAGLLLLALGLQMLVFRRLLSDRVSLYTRSGLHTSGRAPRAGGR